jgi:serine protease AprX
MPEKIQHRLARRMRSRGPGEEIPIIVRYRRDLTVSEADIAGARPYYRLGLFSLAAAKATTAEIEALAESPDVERIWEDQPVHAFLNSSVPHINVPQVWTSGPIGRGIKIAILDTGLDPEHPDFQGRIVNGQDFSGQGVRDRHGHGTHVTGIAAGAGSTYRGAAPGAGIFVAKVLDNAGNGRMSDVIAGLEWSVEQEVDVVNVSLGSSVPSDGSDPLSEACDQVVDRGIVVIVAAGNDGPDEGTIGSPGCARRVITVGATTDRDTIVGFSSRGPTLDGRVKPDIVMPGASIISCRAANTALGVPVNEYYVNISGTSMAAPHAAGAAALLLEADPELSPAEIKARFGKAAVDLDLALNTQGAGRVDVLAAFQNTEPSPPEEPSAPGCLSGWLESLLG